jgi:hypothetical protein
VPVPTLPGRRPAAAWVAVVLLLVLAGCGSAPERDVVPRAQLVLGMGANSLDGGRGHQQDLVLELGIRHLREELTWPKVEPQRGRFAWGDFDDMLASAARRHMTVLPTLLGTPSWLAKDPDAYPPPAAWAGFVAEAVARYGPGGTFWKAHPDLDAGLAPRWFELWNEPYFPFFSGGQPDPARFAAMQRAAVTAGRAANPAARFLMPADSVYTTPAGQTRDWLADSYAADPALGEVFDGIAAHPYGTGSPTRTDGSRRGQVLRLDDLLKTLDAHGDGRKPVWLTEIGWATCRVRPDCTTEQGQARDLGELFRLVTTRWRSRVAALFIYRFDDLDKADPDDALQNFGLLRLDGSHKPAWDVVRRNAEELAQG